jgi:hypothetical protein
MGPFIGKSVISEFTGYLYRTDSKGPYEIKWLPGPTTDF